MTGKGSTREEQLEAALLEYVEKYGLTEAARRVLSTPSKPKPEKPPER